MEHLPSCGGRFHFPGPALAFWFRCLPIGLSLWLGLSSPAAAHAFIERSTPSSDAMLRAPPRQVLLRFSAPVEPKFSTVMVFSASGKRVSRREIVSRDRQGITTPLDRVGPGVHTVRWQTLSSVDGHWTSGVFVFSVTGRQPSTLAMTKAAARQPLSREDARTSLLLITRWIGFLAAFLLVGSVMFQAMVLDPGLPRMHPQDAWRLGERAAARLRVLQVDAAIGLLGILAAEIGIQAGELVEGSLPPLVEGGTFWQFFTETKFGWSVLIRGGFALLLLLPPSPSGRSLQAAAATWLLVIAVLAASLGDPARLLVGDPAKLLVGDPAGLLARFRFDLMFLSTSAYGVVGATMAMVVTQIPAIRLSRLSWAPPMAGALLLSGFTLTAHAARSGPVAVGADWAHLLAASIWIGGLVSLLLVLQTGSRDDRTRLAQALVPRFSTLAGLSLGVLVGSGLYMTLLHIPAVLAFVITPYGRTLLLKFLVVVPLVALGALNRFLLVPRLEAGSHPSVQRFLRLLRGEIGLAAAVCLVAAALVTTPLPRIAAPQATRAAVSRHVMFSGQAHDLRIRLSFAPALPGLNRFGVVVTDRKGHPLASRARVSLRLTKVDDHRPPMAVRLVRRGPGRYGVETAAFAVPGVWTLEVLVRRKGRPQVSAAFPVRIDSEHVRKTLRTP